MFRSPNDVLYVPWGFCEWFIVIWFVCYFITFLAIVFNDRRTQYWLGYSLICMFFWPLIWIYLFWPNEVKKN